MKRLLITLPILALIVTLAIVLFVPSKPRVTSRSTATTDRVPTEQECHDFWQKHMDLQIMQVATGKHPIPEVNARHQLLMSQITARYGKVYKLSPSPAFCPASKDILEGNSYINEEPTVLFFVPALMAAHSRTISLFGPQAEEVFSLMTAVGLMHELDHLANGTTGFSSKIDVPLDELCADEVTTWAQTCEMMIRPLYERGYRLSETHAVYYGEWVLSNRDANSPRWKKFIYEGYSTTR